MTSPHHLSHSPHHPSPLSPHHTLMAHPPTLLQRTASSGSRSIGAASTNSGSGGEHSRESSRSISNRVTDSVTTGNAPIRLGATQPAAGVTDAIRDATSTRPSLRETLSDGLPPSASDFYNLPSSSVGSTGNLAPPNLAHTLSSSPSVGSPAGSVGSPMSANAPTYTASSSLSASSSIQSSLAGSSSTQQQPPVVTPPLAGPLSSSDQRTSLLVLNLPFKVRWQDVKDLFRRSAGTVLRADVSLTPDGRSRGFGSVLMRDGEDAQRAKECFDGFEWMGRKLEVHIERGGGGGWGFAPDGSPLYPTLDSSSTYGVAGSQSQAGLPVPASFNSASPMPHTQALGSQQQSFGSGAESFGPLHYPPGPMQASASPYSGERSFSSGSLLRPDSGLAGGPLDHLSPGSDNRRRDARSPSLAPSNASPSRRPSGAPTALRSSENLLLPPGSSLSQSTTPTLPPPQVQQLRASSFSGGSRRPSAGSGAGLVPGSSGPGSSAASSPGLPLPPFPPPAPSPSSQSSLPPGAIPTQHQLAVLSAQAAQAAVAAQQARVLAEYGGMPDGSYYGRTLFVGNLSYATQWQDLKDLFRAAGNILRADIALGSEGRSRGFGTALFGSKEEAARAVRMFHGYDHNGRTLKVHFDRFARMESPPLGILIPARAEDYTSAFSAAQPPSNLGAGGGGAMKAMGAGGTGNGGSIGGIASPAVYLLQQQQQQLMAAGHSPYALQPQASQMAAQQQQQAMQHQMIPPQQHFPYHQQQQQQQQQPSWSQRTAFGQEGMNFGNGMYTPRGSVSSASGTPSGGSLPPSRSSTPNAGLLQAFEPASQSRRPSALGTASPVVGDEHGYARQPPPSRQVQALPQEISSQAAVGSSTAAKKGGSSRVNAAPGRISLPSPPSMQQQAHPYQQHYAMGSTFSPEGRAPVPMTPGVPLTPGMPGFSFANLPPQTPPAFTAPMMSPGLGMMSPPIPGYHHMPTTPGVQAPPTPWQYPGMSAAPGAPLRMVPPSGGGNGFGQTGGSGFNAFYGGMGGAQMPQTPHWGQPYRVPTQQQQQQSARSGSRAGEVGGERAVSNAGSAGSSTAQTGTAAEAAHMDGSAISSRSASPLPPLVAASDGYPFPAVVSDDTAAANSTKGDAVQMAKGDGAQPASNTLAQPPSSTLKKPHLGPGSISLVSRRASTNSPAISPSVYGAHPASVSNSSFGYFGAALAAGEGAAVEGGMAGSGERARRPSLDADALRTPMRDDLGDGSNYFSPVASGESNNVAGAVSNGNGHSATSKAPTSVPNIAIAAGHASTEEMAKAIAKMSIQGQALLKRGNSNQGSVGGGNRMQSPSKTDLEHDASADDKTP